MITSKKKVEIVYFVIISILANSNHNEKHSLNRVEAKTSQSMYWPGVEGESDLIHPENFRFAAELQIDKLTWIIHCVKHKRSLPLSMPIKIHNRSHFYLLLFACGDSALNTGPVKTPCGICSKPVVILGMAYSHNCYETYWF